MPFELTRLKGILRICVLLSVCSPLFSQQALKGIVVDSVTLNALPNVHVSVKHSNKGAITNLQGIFFLSVLPTDTLVFSSVGYGRYETPVYSDDDVMFVRLAEQPVMLKEIIVRGRPLSLNSKYEPSLKIKSKAVPWYGAVPNGQGGAAVNLDYFSKREREKRKLEKLKAELSSTQVYVDIVTNPEVKQELEDRFSISDSTFYKILTRFNEKNQNVTHSGDSGSILNALFSFFEANARYGKIQ
jgi:hypothetical protein